MYGMLKHHFLFETIEECREAKEKIHELLKGGMDIHNEKAISYYDTNKMKMFMEYRFYSDEIDINMMGVIITLIKPYRACFNNWH